MSAERKVIYSMGVSLDGYVTGPSGEIDWTMPDEELHRFHNERVGELGAHLCGRRLYEEMRYWDTPAADAGGRRGARRARPRARCGSGGAPRRASSSRSRRSAP